MRRPAIFQTYDRNIFSHCEKLRKRPPAKFERSQIASRQKNERGCNLAFVAVQDAAFRTFIAGIRSLVREGATNRLKGRQGARIEYINASEIFNGDLGLAADADADADADRCPLGRESAAGRSRRALALSISKFPELPEA